MSVFDIIEPITQQSLLKSGIWYIAYMLYHFAGAKLMPSVSGYGFPTPQKTRKDYQLTGLQMFLSTTTIYLISRIIFGVSIVPIISNFWSLFVASNIFSVIFSSYLFLKGKIIKAPKFENTSFLPNWMFEFWCGLELNPTISGVDLKMYFYQPSLIGLHLFSLAFAEYQYNTIGYLTYQMVLFQLFLWLYLFTHYIKEEFMLSTWDIIEEHFGFMLVWGDMVYVPFWYSVVGWYLADQSNSISLLQCGMIVAIHITGHYIFRVSNWQKYMYKRYGKKSSFFGVESKLLEDRLLISGFWGIGRHLNYTGEILTYLSFALTSGYVSIVPYILPISLLGLLTQRAWRDDQRCSAKYKQLWTKYCSIATFKMIPGIY